MAAKKGLYSDPSGGTDLKPKVSGTKKPRNATSSLETLQKIKESSRAEHGRPKRTRDNYAGYVERGKSFLEDLVAERRANVDRVDGNSKVSNCDVPDDDIDVDLLEKAFDNPPNKYSVMVMELYLVQKCLTENRGKSTAAGIQGAFADYWDNMDGDTYGGPYSFDKETETVKGCPAHSSTIKSYIKVIGSKSGAKGAAAAGRHHAEAMRIEELKKIMEWSETEYPSKSLTSAADSLVDLDELMLAVEHTMMRAFMTSGFTLWTRYHPPHRNFELTGLQARDIMYGFEGPAPYFHPYFKVHLENRKGWQRKLGHDGPLESNTYNIYQQDILEIDMYTHLRKWIALLKGRLGRELEPDDYIFPHFSPNGILDPARQMTHDMVQILITRFASSAGLTKPYTTHCFRRGGAQYRFMYAPIGRRWSLCKIRWWGGWVIGEHVDTLMKYLVDSLQSYENDYGNSLCPVQNEPDQSFMGEHALLKPVTVHEFRMFGSSIMSALKTTSTNTTCSQINTVTPAGLSNPNVASAPMSMSTTGLSIKSIPIFPIPISTPSPVPTAFTTLTPSCFQPESEQAATLVTTNNSAVGTGKCIPLAGVCIPDLPRSRGSWRIALRQWYDVDPKTGRALKDWPDEWFKDSMRGKTAAKRSQRALIAHEYDL
ncbi:hypothetical protein BYT27DRAFT_7122783 [Phlegmacium glaucopus]|nr:hypothetical protein BYT27DRAFT_7122783 [Phlegmacium glaucopus]